MMEGEEGGSVSDEENPFSFDIFMKQTSTKSKNTTGKKSKKKKGKNDAGKFVDIFSDEMPVAGTSTGTRSTTDDNKQNLDHDLGLSERNPSELCKSGEQSNPFSFKRFLKKDAKHSSSGSSSSSQDEEDLSIDGPLPNFHNEHFSGGNIQPTIGRTDFDSTSLPTESAVDTTLVDVFPQKFGRRKKISELPDIFADLDDPDDLETLSKEEIIVKMKRVKEENKVLKRDLKDAQNAATKESDRVAAMLKEMKKVHQREAEDTQALENMVHQVEQNLKLTTTRAVAAETMVTQLKQEVKALKGQMSALGAEKQQLEAERISVNAITQTALTAAEKLSVGATTAEPAIRQLLQGLDMLKLISETLSSIAVVTEEHTSGSTQQSS